MKSNYTLSLYRRVYERLKWEAIKLTEKGCYNKAIEAIIQSSKLAFYINDVFSDKQLDKLCKTIAQVKLHEVETAPQDSLIVYIDSNCAANHGLTQQYIRSFIHNHYKFIFVRIDPVDPACEPILSEIREYHNAQIITFENKVGAIEKASIILKLIENTCPSEIFFHLTPWDATAVLVSCMIKNIPKYYVNAIDHTFWLGASFFDYLVDFRDVGFKVSVEKRLFSPSKIYKLPYYPIINRDSVPFKGFPSQTNNKIVVYSGGAAYKMLSETNLYFKAIESLLEVNKNVVVLISCIGIPNEIKKIINTLKNNDRIILLGYRDDIQEVFKHCDIYLTTYPIGGGLMGQYACVYKKPILTLYEKWNSLPFSELSIGNPFTSLKDFLNYGSHLIESEEFRKSEGERLARNIISEDDFDKNVNMMLRQNRTNYSFSNVSKISIDFNRYTELYLYMENTSLHRVPTLILRFWGLKGIILFPQFYYSYYTLVIVKLKRLLNI